MTFRKATNPTIPPSAQGLSGEWYACGDHLARIYESAGAWAAIVYDAVKTPKGIVSGAGHHVLGSSTTEAGAVDAAGVFLELSREKRMNTPADIDSARAARKSGADGKPKAIRAKAKPEDKPVTSYPRARRERKGDVAPLFSGVAQASEGGRGM